MLSSLKPKQIMPMLRSFLILAALTICSLQAQEVSTDQSLESATDEKITWQVPPEDDDEFDWMQLYSGEWLKGEIISLQADSLTFDSEEMDELSFDWEDVHFLISPHVNTLVFDDGVTREEVYGVLRITRETVTINNNPSTARQRKDLFGIISGEPTELNYWSGKFSVGVTLRGGNTDEVEFNNRMALARITPATRMTLGYQGNYGKTDEVETANNHRGTITADVFLTRKLFVRTPFAEYYRDLFQNLSHQATVGAGAGYDIFNRFNSSDVEWSVTLGPAYHHRWYESVAVGERTDDGGAVLAAGTRFNWDITKRVEFTLDHRSLIAASSSVSTTHHTELIWEIEVTDIIDLDTSFIWDYTENPTADESGNTPEQSDYRLVLSLGIDF